MNVKLVRELELFEDKEREYARQGKGKTKEIHALQDQVAELERTLHAAKKNGGGGGGGDRHAREGLQRLQAEVEEAGLAVRGLQQVLQLKNRELSSLRTHATTILEQRTEVEQFFIDALAQCKEEMGEERQRAYRQSLAEYRFAMREATNGNNDHQHQHQHNGQNYDYGNGQSPRSPTSSRRASPPNSSKKRYGKGRGGSVGGGGVSGGSGCSGGGGGGGAADTIAHQHEGEKAVGFPKIRAAATQRGVLGGKLPGGLPEGKQAVLGLDGLPVGRHEKSLPIGPPATKVQLSDLSWGDREKVR